MRLPLVPINSLLLAVLFYPIDTGRAGDLVPHRQRTRTRQSLPARNYGQNAWPFTTPSSFKATAFAVAATDPTIVGQQIKPFSFRETALVLDHLTLEDVGLSLYESNGHFFASGKISNSGGDGGLIGNNVTIRIRAYVSPTAEMAVNNSVPNNATAPTTIASPNDATRIPPDSFVVWASEYNLWVPRGGPHSISLLSPDQNFADTRILHKYFYEITHLEVELEYKRDR